MHYDVTIITVRPGTEQKALARLKETLPSVAGDELLACWYSDIGSLNRILLIRAAPDVMRIHADREKILRSGNPFGVGEYVVGTSVDTYVSFPFMPPMGGRAIRPRLRGAHLYPQAGRAADDDRAVAEMGAGPHKTITAARRHAFDHGHGDAIHAHLAVRQSRRAGTAARQSGRG